MSYGVDYDALGDLGVQLGALRDEFNGVEDGIHSYEWAIGHGGVAGKLNRFASNWSDKRKKIAEHVDGLSQASCGAAQGYCDTDTQIASSISGNGGDTGSSTGSGPQ